MIEYVIQKFITTIRSKPHAYASLLGIVIYIHILIGYIFLKKNLDKIVTFNIYMPKYWADIEFHLSDSLFSLFLNPYNFIVKKIEIPKHSFIHFFEIFLGCINNSETVDENGFSKSQLDNLYSYYSQFEDTPDPIECIIETYKRNQNQTKTRLNVIQVWLFFKKLLEKLAFCYQNWSDLLWEKNALVIEKNFWNSRLKAENFQKILRSLEQFIQTVKGKNNFW